MIIVSILLLDVNCFVNLVVYKNTLWECHFCNYIANLDVFLHSAMKYKEFLTKKSIKMLYIKTYGIKTHSQG